MNEQPLALLLADKLEQQFPLGTAQNFLDGEAAAELRRLHGLNQELLESLRWAIRQMPEPVFEGTYTDGYRKARAAIAKAKQEEA